LYYKYFERTVMPTLETLDGRNDPSIIQLIELTKKVPLREANELHDWVDKIPHLISALELKKARAEKFQAMNLDPIVEYIMAVRFMLGEHKGALRNITLIPNLPQAVHTMSAESSFKVEAIYYLISVIDFDDFDT